MLEQKDPLFLFSLRSNYFIIQKIFKVAASYMFPHKGNKLLRWLRQRFVLAPDQGYADRHRWHNRNPAKNRLIARNEIEHQGYANLISDKLLDRLKLGGTQQDIRCKAIFNAARINLLVLIGIGLLQNKLFIF